MMQNNRSIFAHAIPRSRRALARASFLKSHMTDSKNSMQTLNRGRVAHGYFGNQSVMGCAMTTCFRHGISANMDTPLSVNTQKAGIVGGMKKDKRIIPEKAEFVCVE